MPLIQDTFPYLPLWLAGVLFCVALLLAREAGHWARQRVQPVRPKDKEDDPFAMTSVLGLFALLLGFSFSIALQKYETRRELVVHEANALGTTWLRTELLDSPDREALQNVLRRYVDQRIAYAGSTSARQERTAYAQSEALQTEVWATLMRVITPFRDTPRAGLLVGTTNESFDLAATRQAERQAHIPARALRMLTLFALVSATMVGYERGSQRRATTLMFVLITLAVTLVLDLDRPGTGLVTVPQQPMLDLQASMKPAQAAVVR